MHEDERRPSLGELRGKKKKTNHKHQPGFDNGRGSPSDSSRVSLPRVLIQSLGLVCVHPPPSTTLLSFFFPLVLVVQEKRAVPGMADDETEIAPLISGKAPLYLRSRGLYLALLTGYTRTKQSIK